MKKLEGKAGEEQMSEKCFTWADGVDILKFLEGARCVEEVVKEPLPPLFFLQSEFQFL